MAYSILQRGGTRGILSGTTSYDELFKIQDDLDSGTIGSVKVGNEYKHTDGGLFSSGRDEMVGPVNEDKNTFGSLLGQTDALNAYKKRKTDQSNLANQGIGRSQSILGGTVV